MTARDITLRYSGVVRAVGLLALVLLAQVAGFLGG